MVVNLQPFVSERVIESTDSMIYIYIYIYILYGKCHWSVKVNTMHCQCFQVNTGYHTCNNFN